MKPFRKIFFALFFLTTLIIGQEIPIVFPTGVPSIVEINSNIRFDFEIDRYVVMKYRYRLEAPNVWSNKNNYAVNQWSEWRNNNTDEAYFVNLFQVGSYKFIIEYKDYYNNKRSITRYFEVRSHSKYSNNYQNYNNYSDEQNRDASLSVTKTSNIITIDLKQENIFLPKLWQDKKNMKALFSEGLLYNFSIETGKNNYLVIDLFGKQLEDGAYLINAKRGIFVLLFPKQFNMDKQNIKVEWIDFKNQKIRGAYLPGLEKRLLSMFNILIKYCTGFDIGEKSKKFFESIGAGKLEKIYLGPKFYQLNKYNIYVAKWESTFSNGVQIKADTRRIKIPIKGDIKKYYNQLINKNFAFLDFVNIYNVGGSIAVVYPGQNVVSPNKKNPNIVYVQGGTFEMGSNDGDNDEKPIHRVRVDDFYIGKYEVTVKEFSEFINASGYRTTAEKEGWSWLWNGSSWKKRNNVNWQCDVKGNKRSKSESNHPVIHVSWYDAVAYCNWLSEQEGLQKFYNINGNNVIMNWGANGYRLPTEVEWEFAARGGNLSNGFKYSGNNYIGDVAWFFANSNVRTHNVGEKAPNELGIYDMSGNVWEWCNDWYEKNYYSNSPRNNPKGPSSVSSRVSRGGSWYVNAYYCRSANRGHRPPDRRTNSLGFRISRTAH